MIQDRINKDIIAALKSRDSVRLGVLRFVKSKINEREIELRNERDVTDEDVNLILKRLIKQRNQAIKDATQANRSDLIEEEQEQLRILQEYYNEQ